MPPESVVVEPVLRRCHIVHSQHKSAGNTLHDASRYAPYLVNATTGESMHIRKWTDAGPRYSCDTAAIGPPSHGWNYRTRQCFPPPQGFDNLQNAYNGWVLSMAEVYPFRRERCAWLSSFREPYDRLVSSLLYCRLNDVTRSDPLCGTEFLDARNATIRSWAKHWGNYLMRDLLLFPPLLRSTHPNPLPPMPTTGPVWHHLKKVLGDRAEGHTSEGRVNMHRIVSHLLNNSIYDAFLLYERWNESVEILNYVLPLHGISWSDQLAKHAITHSTPIPRTHAASVSSSRSESSRRDRDALVTAARNDPEVTRSIAADIFIYAHGVLPRFNALLSSVRQASRAGKGVHRKMSQESSQLPASTHMQSSSAAVRMDAELSRTSPSVNEHTIAVLCVGVLRGLRSAAQRDVLNTFLNSLGPSSRVDVFAVFELVDSNDTIALGPRAANSGDKACSEKEREALIADAFGRNQRVVHVRMETPEEVAEARSLAYRPRGNGWALSQFHKVRLAYADLESHERARGWRYTAILRIRTD